MPLNYRAEIGQQLDLWPSFVSIRLQHMLHKLHDGNERGKLVLPQSSKGNVLGCDPHLHAYKQELYDAAETIGELIFGEA